MWNGFNFHLFGFISTWKETTWKTEREKNAIVTDLGEDICDGK
jgi:hypothetical protein